MAQTDRTANGIVEGVIWKQLLKFVFPIMFGMLFQQLYNTVDAMVVGRFVGKEALAAVGGPAAQILYLIIGFFVGLSSGATVIVSQFFGAKKDGEVSRSVHTAFALAVIGGAVIMALGLASAPWLLRIMKTPEDIMEPSLIYLQLIYAGMIPSAVYNIGSGVLRAVGDARRPLYFLIICCLLNVVLDLAFVLWLDMGVAGVALATGLAQAVSAALICVAMCRTKDSYRLKLRGIRIHGDLLKRTLHIGLPTGLSSVMFSASSMIVGTYINTFGTVTVAAFVVFSKVDAIFFLILNPFSVAITTFVGQNYGAKRYDRVRKSVRVCISMAMGAALIYCASVLLFGRQICGLFTTEAEVVEIAVVRMLSIMGPCYWIYVPLELTGGSLRGMGVTVVPTIITTIGICVIRLIWLFLVVPHIWAIETIMFSYPMTWALTAVAFLIYYHYKKRKLLPE